MDIMTAEILKPEITDPIKGHLKSLNYFFEEGKWYKKKNVVLIDKIIKDLEPVIEQYSLRLAVKKDVPIILDHIKTEFEVVEDENSFDKFAWEKAYSKLNQLRWSNLDEEVWHGFKWTVIDGQSVVIAPTGQGKEYAVVGTTDKEVYNCLAAVSHSVYGNRLQFIDKKIILPLIEYCTDPSFNVIDLPYINGDILPASVCDTLYVKNVIKEEDEYVGAGIKYIKKPTSQLYIQYSFEVFLSLETNRVNDLVPVTNDPTVPTYRYLDTNYPEGPTPTFDTFINNFIHPKESRSVLLQWIASVVIAENTGSQIMWIVGEGGDGKSVLAEALSNYLGIAAANTTLKELKTSFGMSIIENRRLIVMADQKNPNLVKDGLVHTITGNDTVAINRKYGSYYKSKLIGKLLVLENMFPDISMYENNQVRRVIVLQIKAPSKAEKAKSSHYRMNDEGEYVYVGNNFFRTNMIKEIPHILNLAMKEYNKHVINHASILVPSKLFKLLESNVKGRDELLWDHFVEKAFKQGNAKSYVEAKILHKMIEDFANTNDINHNQFTITNVKRMMTVKFSNCSSIRKRINGELVTVMTGIGLNENYNIEALKQQKDMVHFEEDIVDELAEIMSTKESLRCKVI